MTSRWWEPMGRKELPCCKAILAAVSPVFRVMFFRDFRERNKDRCNISFHSVVITLVAKYCYCGELDVDFIFSENRSLEEEASLLVDVYEAGRYFQIEDLSSVVEARIGNLVFPENAKKKYPYASAFLMELFKREKHHEPLGLAIFQFTVDNAMKCFGPRALENSSAEPYHTHPSVLADVLRDSNDTYTVAKCIET